jgi:membrane protein DedA with SNARE-associated domain/membrane-associated phospholipid phosphatase
MIEHYAHAIIQFLQANPRWGGLITFIIAFLESLAVVGTIVPGSVTMTLVGILVGTSVLPLGRTLLWATLGAFLGDLLGYWIGTYYNVRLRSMWPFNKYPHWLVRGERFFHKHGGKSILIGRFVGPLRSIIPLIAGLLHMPLKRFIFAALPTAFLWSLAYLLPGILIGALSLQLPPKLATSFILILLVVIIVLSLFAWVIKFFSTQIRKALHHFLKKSWYYLQDHKLSRWFIRLIANPENHDHYQQLGWFFLFVLASLLFAILFVSVFRHNLLLIYNLPIYEFLRTIRSTFIDHIMIGITSLGDGKVILPSSCFVLGWLLLRKKKWAALHWLIAILIGIIIPNFIKYLFYSPRPTGLLRASSSSSFPSGHTFLSAMYYGFFAIFVASHIRKKYRPYPYYFAAIIILLVAFSRMYLGAHWLTDVIGSILLGIALLALTALSYRRKTYPVKIISFTIFSSLITLVIWVCYFGLSYQKNILRYSLNWPSQVINSNTWWGKQNNALPIFRQNRIGRPAEPMNIQFSGNILHLEKKLIQKGWIANPNTTLLSNTIEKLSGQTNITTYLPSLYLNNPPSLYMIKDDANTKLILKLWRSNVYLSDIWDVIYIGNIIEYEINNNKQKITYTYNAINRLLFYIPPDGWRTNIIITHQIPQILLKLKWNGEILQISTPTLY